MFTFKTKEEYLAYIKQWKTNYAHITHCIRVRRLLYKENIKIWSKAVLMSGAISGKDCAIIKAFNIVEELRKEQSEQHKKLEIDSKSTDFVWYSSEDATNALEELKQAKLESQRQYLEQKKILVA